MWGDWNEPKEDDDPGLPPLPAWMRGDSNGEEEAIAVAPDAPPSSPPSLPIVFVERGPQPEAEAMPPAPPSTRGLADWFRSMRPFAPALPAGPAPSTQETSAELTALTEALAPEPVAPEPASLSMVEPGSAAAAEPEPARLPAESASLPEPLFLAEPEIDAQPAGSATPADPLVLATPSTPEPENDPQPSGPETLLEPLFFGGGSTPESENDRQPAGSATLPEPLFLACASTPEPETAPHSASDAALPEPLFLASWSAPEPQLAGRTTLPEPLFLASPPAADEATTGPVALMDADPPPAPTVMVDAPSAARAHLEEVMRSLDASLTASTGTARIAAPPSPQIEEARYVVFFLQGARWAVPIEDVLEMGTVPKVTPLPNVPGFVRGVANLRGEVLAVLDLRGVLGFDSPSDPLRERMLVVKAPGRDAVGGFVVDGVRGLARLAPGAITPPVLPAGEHVGHFLRGVSGHDGALLNVLDTQTLFDTPEMLRLAAG